MYQVTKYRDGQVSASVGRNHYLDVVISGRTYEDLFVAASVKESWDYKTRAMSDTSSRLTIKCLIGQRSDRRFKESGSFDLKVIAGFINSMNFDTVEILHPHSSVALALINNSKEGDYERFVWKSIALEEATVLTSDKVVLISPDAGAYKSVHLIAEEFSRPMVPANKVRIDGEPQIVVQGDVKDKTCLIVDDIADGGRTFIELAKKLKDAGAKRVALYVTHGMFHYGFEEIFKHIDHVYCTDSYGFHSEPNVTQFSLSNE